MCCRSENNYPIMRFVYLNVSLDGSTTPADHRAGRKNKMKLLLSLNIFISDYLHECLIVSDSFKNIK